MPLIIGTNKNEGLLIKVKQFSQELSKLTANEQILKLKENIFLDLKTDRKNYFSTNLNFLALQGFFQRDGGEKELSSAFFL